MKYKLITALLVLAIASWAQTSSQSDPAAPPKDATAKCVCCEKMAPADAKEAHACMHHGMKGSDGKEMGCCSSCGEGKDAKSCTMAGKDENAKSCCAKKPDDKAGVCCGDKCSGEGKSCCAANESEKAAATCCARRMPS